MDFPLHTLESAPDGAKDILGSARKGLGFLPNLLAVMADSPALLKGYLSLSRIFDETSFTPTERQVVLLTVSRENNCEYCVAAHTAIAGMQSISPEVIDAVRRGQPTSDSRLNALTSFTSQVVASRGWPSEAQVQDFLAAGYERRHVLDVLLGVGLKTLSNYTNHIAETELDQAFSKVAWTKAA